MVSAVPYVDYVIVFNEISPKKIINILKPDIFVKGGDYPLSGVIEKDIVARYGGKIEVIPKIDGPSTTSIIEEILKKYK